MFHKMCTFSWQLSHYSSKFKGDLTVCISHTENNSYILALLTSKTNPYLTTFCTTILSKKVQEMEALKSQALFHPSNVRKRKGGVKCFPSFVKRISTFRFYFLSFQFDTSSFEGYMSSFVLVFSKTLFFLHSFEHFSLFCKKGSIQKGGIPFEISTSSENKAIVWIHFICLKLSNEHFSFKMNFKEIGNVRLGKCNNHEITLLAITCTIYFFKKISKKEQF